MTGTTQPPGDSAVGSVARRVAVVVVVAVAVLAGVWAGRTVLAPPADPFEASTPVIYEVVEGSIGRSLPTTVLAQWDLTVVASAAGDGTVTSVDLADGSEVGAGDVVATIDLRPVVVAEGEVPAFRAMAEGTRGDDVAQLQRLLAGLGFAVDATGVFDEQTTAAVSDWQSTLGVDPDGQVALGDVVFVEDLPGRMAVAPGIRRGTRVGAGVSLLLAVPSEPRWWMLLTREQSSQVRPGTPVIVDIGGSSIEAAVERIVEDVDQGRFEAEIAASDGDSLCPAGCADVVPLDEEIHVFPAALELTVERTGPVVPISGLVSTPDGRSVVTMSDGTERAVTIVGASAGLAVVDGVEVGESIVLPFSDE